MKRNHCRKNILALLLAGGMLLGSVPAWAANVGSGDSSMETPPQPEPVPPPQPMSVSLASTSCFLKTGAVRRVTARFSAKPQQLSVSSSDLSVVSAALNSTEASGSGYKNQLFLTAVHAGTATVTVTADGVQASCSVTVSDPVVEVTGITLSRTALSLTPGGTAALTASVTPSDATDGTVRWSTSNSKICTVSGGTVTARNVGTTTVTASAGGHSASCTVTVAESPADDSDVPDAPDVPDETPDTPVQPNTSTPPSSGTFQSGTVTPSTTVVSDGTVTISLGTSKFSVKKPEHISAGVSLTFATNLNATTKDVLDALEVNSVAGTFFVTTDSILAHDDLVRRIVGSGHSLGILLTAEQAQSKKSCLQALSAANENLNLVCGVPTRLVTVSGGSAANVSEEVQQALADTGYRLWDEDLFAAEKEHGAESAARGVIQKTDTTDTRVVRFGCNSRTAATLDFLLPYLNYFDIPTKVIMDSDVTVCTLKE